MSEKTATPPPTTPPMTHLAVFLKNVSSRKDSNNSAMHEGMTHVTHPPTPNPMRNAQQKKKGENSYRERIEQKSVISVIDRQGELLERHKLPNTFTSAPWETQILNDACVEKASSMRHQCVIASLGTRFTGPWPPVPTEPCATPSSIESLPRSLDSVHELVTAWVIFYSNAADVAAKGDKKDERR